MFSYHLETESEINLKATPHKLVINIVLKYRYDSPLLQRRVSIDREDIYRRRHLYTLNNIKYLITLYLFHQYHLQ